jgi:purine-binding chemotaxis protein CheW
MSDLFLIVEIAGIEVAIRSECIESVVTIGDVVTVPKSDPLVAGLIALRSRVLTLIDCQYAVSAKPSQTGSGMLAVIANISGHPYALKVEAVRDVVSADADAIKPASRLDPRWARIAHEVVEFENRMIIILSPEMLLVPQTALAA